MASKPVRQYQQPSSGLDGWAQSLPDAFIQCRDFGHTWAPWRAELTGEHTYSRTLRCQRCTTERRQELSVSGHTLSSAYTYAEDYQAPKGTGRLDSADRDVLRLASTIRLIEGNAGNGAKDRGGADVRPVRGRRGRGGQRGPAGPRADAAGGKATAAGPVRRASKRAS